MIDLKNQTFFITGVAGFIGSNLAKKLLSTINNITIIGIDNLNNYYDVNLKKARLNELYKHKNFIFIQENIKEKNIILDIFKKYKPDIVINLAAQAGVRYSLINPDAYVESNIIGFFNVLEACRYYNVKHLVFASSSSVYGLNKKIPYSTQDRTDKPVSFYAATKKSDELMAYTYAKLYKIPITGLRFFTVYGPAGRPDMAYFSFTKKLVNGEDIQIFNYGNCKRDFTYIDDIVEGIIKVLQKAPNKDEDNVQYKLYNIGNNNPENLLDFVNILQQELVNVGLLPKDYDFEAHKKLVPMQAGDVEITYADIDELIKDFNFKPSTNLKDGLRAFIKWYKDYYIK
ncbi:dTDP-glucose 4,6-dehydratase [Megamonas hypermegale]|uniref:dTDP-glucose 4,6-dehydratase n=1 Tax=Megamonas hypermegale TaxID=158847 RepID=A0A239T7L4_9FIRM|nr:NAD-dependent epimerase/dehydratase family protein [Megamonas hypermegale]SNU93730.1 dTDP-glucose 4,6-dehydratase [Megamonas hypermegale]